MGVRLKSGGAGWRWWRGGRGLAWALVVVLLVAAPRVASAQRRVALVIGNAAYEAPRAELSNAVDDARAVAGALEELDFDVLLRTDLDREEMSIAAVEFAAELSADDVALFYYAGHAMELDDQENYLAPVDLVISPDGLPRVRQVQAESRSVRANVVLEYMEAAGARTRIVILDACRDNPFEPLRTVTRGGLGPMAPRGGLVAYAAQPRRAASDDGLYARLLVEALRVPGLPAAEVFTRVSVGVEAASGGAQLPMHQASGAVGRFVFYPGEVVDPPRPRRRRGREVFRDCLECPEMVVMAGGRLALGRYEVTVGEYGTFASASDGGANDCILTDSWRNPGFPQTDRHPVVCVSWNDAQEYLSWLSRVAGAEYRLPTSVEWDRAAAGSRPGCHETRTGNQGTCAVGASDPNEAGLSDMLGNVVEWTADCWEDNCGLRVVRGDAWYDHDGENAIEWFTGRSRLEFLGFRVARTLDAAAPPPEPVRVGDDIPRPTRVGHVEPRYPRVAQLARVQGVVILELVIGLDGRVTDAEVLRSVPLLDEAATEAVLQWVYTPTLIDGVAVPVIMSAIVPFSLP